MVALFFVLGVALLVLGYFTYGHLVARWLGVDNARPTPAHTIHDDPEMGKDPTVRYDYAPARAAVLFGHHFSSIAGAGPIAGPIIAAAAFGWLPVALWIVLGSVLIGGVQDLASLVASVRNRARSIGEISRRYLSPLGYRLMLAFIYLTLLYVTVVFLDLTSSTFTKSGGVASSSVMYIVLAVIFGILVVRRGLPLWLGSVCFVPLVFAGIWAGQQLPMDPRALGIGRPEIFWDIVLLSYCFVASVLPVWLLLQPRDYLSSFLLFGCLLGGLAGILAGALSGGLPSAGLPALGSLSDPHLGALLPALFITVACGASSGFHTLVASGTTAKQLDREAHALPVAYGGMLLEGVLALIALVAVVLVGTGGGEPTVIFSQGMGSFLGALGLDPSLGAAFGLLAVSTFLLTTLDTCTRLGRYVFEELTHLRGPLARYLATGVTLAIPAVFVMVPFTDSAGKPVAPWKIIWPVFGATNQLLGGLALLVVVLWLRDKKRRLWYVAAPCVFMVCMTLWSLGAMVLSQRFATVVRVLALVLSLLAVAVTVEVIRALRQPVGGESGSEDGKPRLG
ncbi:MAG: carbon starvation CstA family protein [Polyangia bacterium]|jgi:carbon starvation protein|nr:carbon starvation CstA family protein [Polyangia bacterium]